MLTELDFLDVIRLTPLVSIDLIFACAWGERRKWMWD